MRRCDGNAGKIGPETAIGVAEEERGAGANEIANEQQRLSRAQPSRFDQIAQRVLADDDRCDDVVNDVAPLESERADPGVKARRGRLLGWGERGQAGTSRIIWLQRETEPGHVTRASAR